MKFLRQITQKYQILAIGRKYGSQPHPRHRGGVKKESFTVSFKAFNGASDGMRHVKDFIRTEFGILSRDEYSQSNEYVTVDSNGDVRVEYDSNEHSFDPQVVIDWCNEME